MKACYCLLKDYGFIQVTGPDAETFLQGQLTCDLTQVTDSHATLGASCNLKGRVISLFYLAKSAENTYLLRMPRDVIPALLTHLKKFALFSKVELSDHSDSLQVIALDAQGVSSFLEKEPPKTNEVIQHLDSYVVKAFAASPFYELWFSSEEMLAQALQENDSEISINQWEQSQIDAQIPEVFAITSEAFTPHELNLPDLGGVHFDKGCYQGQEIVARMHYRGTLKQHLYQASLPAATTVEPNEKLSQGERTVGYVVRNCQLTESTKLLVLCKDKAKQDSEVMVAGQVVEFL